MNRYRIMKTLSFIVAMIFVIVTFLFLAMVRYHILDQIWIGWIGLIASIIVTIYSLVTCGIIEDLENEQAKAN